MILLKLKHSDNVLAFRSKFGMLKLRDNVLTEPWTDKAQQNETWTNKTQQDESWTDK